MDGDYMPISEAKISVLDWGFLRSDATYDVVHVWKGRFFRLDHHLDRFMASIDKLHLTLPFGRAELIEILRQCVKRSGLQDAYVEMVLTRGISPTFSRDPRDAVNTFIAFAIPFGWIATEEQRQRGLQLHVASIPRISPASVDPTVKNYHWLDFVNSLYEAYGAERENVILTDGHGNITEGPGFNVFALKDGMITTPDSGVLKGITRQTAIDLCAELDLPVVQAHLPTHDLKDADEVFITSTAGGIMPVSQIDEKTIGKGGPGAITQTLSDLYWQKHQDPDWTTPVG
ncbi:MAG: aminotransferase class IV [Rhodospirillales bacterium]|nr:aminotransferase class IV [Rhodospirillales bacterium]